MKNAKEIDGEKFPLSQNLVKNMGKGKDNSVFPSPLRSIIIYSGIGVGIIILLGCIYALFRKKKKRNYYR
jgi:hypothetical protein